MKLQVTIERSLISGISSMVIFGVLILLLFFGEMMLFMALPLTNDKLQDILPNIALVSSLLFSGLLIYIDEKRHGNTQQLQIEIEKDQLAVTQGRKEFVIPLTEIREVTKVMRFDRIYPEKGKYKVVIKRRKHRSLTFMTTEQEYANHADFEDTDLAKFYFALRSHGIKCC